MAKILASEKVMELRSSYCRIIPPGGHFYLLQTSVKGQAMNSKGQKCLELVGRAEFVSNSFIPHACVKNFEHLHRVSVETYSFMRSAWAKDSGGCIGWRFNLLQTFNPSKYVAHSGQDSTLPVPKLKYMKCFVVVFGAGLPPLV